MGILQGMTAEQIADSPHDAIFQQWRADRVHYRVPEGENFVDLRARVIPAVNELVRAFMGRRVALVCHAGPIRVALAEALGLPLEHIFRLGVNHCSIHVIEYAHEEPPRITLVNG